MIELMISACLMSGAGCRHFSQLFDASQVSLMTCMVAGQPAIAAWQQDHPGWTVERWRCRVTEQREVAA